jgi:hypothetical protein
MMGLGQAKSYLVCVLISGDGSIIIPAQLTFCTTPPPAIQLLWVTRLSTTPPRVLHCLQITFEGSIKLKAKIDLLRQRA